MKNIPPMARLAIATISFLLLAAAAHFYRLDAISKSLIKPEQMKYSDGFLQLGPSYAISGKIKNNADQFTVTALKMRLSLYDCPPGEESTPEEWMEKMTESRKDGYEPPVIDESSGCRNIKNVTVKAKIEIPPGKRVEFREPLSLNSIPKYRRLAWRLTFETIKAK